jgi:hypothetical protein
MWTKERHAKRKGYLYASELEKFNNFLRDMEHLVEKSEQYEQVRRKFRYSKSVISQTINDMNEHREIIGEVVRRIHRHVDKDELQQRIQRLSGLLQEYHIVLSISEVQYVRDIINEYTAHEEAKLHEMDSGQIETIQEYRIRWLFKINTLAETDDRNISDFPDLSDTLMAGEEELKKQDLPQLLVSHFLEHIEIVKSLSAIRASIEVMVPNILRTVDAARFDIMEESTLD